MKLWELIPQDIKTVSVIGMAKNAGKTVTLNRLLAERRGEGIVGLTSIGRDGELEDVVTGTQKPGILVLQGTLLATTDDCLKRSDARVEILGSTGERTPVGQVVIARVRQSGHVELAGPDTSRGIRHVCRQLSAHGADKVLVDGALNRKSSASPCITDASILATGAVLDRDLSRVVKETAYQVNLLNLPCWTYTKFPHNPSGKESDSLYDWISSEGAAGILNGQGNLRVLNLPTVLNAGKDIGRELAPGDQAVLIRGSLTGKTVRDIIATTDLYREVDLVIEDATRIFIEERDWLIWAKMGLRISVLQKTRLLLITINPWSPGGWSFDGDVFLQEMRRAVNPVPVMNVLGREEEE